MDNMNISDIMSKVMENPELMNSLKATAESLFGSISEEAENTDRSEDYEEGRKNQSNDKETVPEIKNDTKDISDDKRIENEQRVQLLLALKPYMDENRREKIDYMLKIMKLLQISEIGSLLKNFF